MAIKIGISFKDTEVELANFLKTKISASIYVKELIVADMEKVKKESNIELEKEKLFKKSLIWRWKYYFISRFRGAIKITILNAT